MNLITNWSEVIKTGNLSENKKMDFISRWLIIIRVGFFSITPTAVLIGALLAAIDGSINILNTTLVLLAMLLAHGSSNMINDYFDYEYGLDSGNYTRMKYSLHPIGSNLTSKTGLITAFIIFTIIEAGIGVYFYFTGSIYAILIAVIGFLISFFYTAPPVKLKYIGGLGEPSVFIVWGPLMTVGSYYVVAGTMPLHAWLASIPFGLLVMNVLLCDHVNKYEDDVKAGVKTLPVVIGLKNTFTLLKVTTTLFYVIITALVLFGMLPVFSLLVYLAMPQFLKLMKIFSSPKPEMTKENEQIYHAWYIVWMFNFSKPAGWLFLAGLAIGAVPWHKLINELKIFMGG